MRYVLSILFMAFVAVCLCAQQPNTTTKPATVPYTKDSLTDVKKRMESKKAILVDVRSEKEWKRSHLKESKFIPTPIFKDAAKCSEATKKFDKKQIVYVHCAKGARAKVCAGVLAKMGFDARPLKVNYEEFPKAGFKEVKN